jgi:chromate transporter
VSDENDILTEAPDGRPPVSFAEAFRFWVKLGFISFGGPAGQIAIMHKELVEKRRWLSEERFLHALNYCMLLPGPEAKQLAIYIGWLMHRVRGGIVAGFFFIFPSVVLLLALSYVYAAYGNVTFVAGVLAGFKPVVVAIVVEAIVKIGRKALKRGVHFAIAAGAFAAIYFLQIPFPLVVVAAALIGLIWSRVRPNSSFASSDRPEGQGQAASDTPDCVQEAPTGSSRSRVLKVLAVGLGMWVLPFVMIGLWLGWDGLHAQQYRFFTQAALVTFGGAYAVLAYVIQATANDFGWITESQAVDGLALAETTPGPLIMVLQFIGFMAGWNNPVAGMSAAQTAVLSALVTSYVTFLPSFLFIFIGAPYIEALRGNRNLTGALSGVTAAVVGVILNLALVFAAAVIWPSGISQNIEWFSALVSVAAFIALYRFKASVVLVVLAGGLIGLARTFFFAN